MTREEYNLVLEYVREVQRFKDRHNEDGAPINYGTICTLVMDGWDLIEKIKPITTSLIEKVKELPPVTPEPNRCNQCKYYEGVHNVQGHAPCSFLKCGGVLWDWHCSNYEPYKG